MAELDYQMALLLQHKFEQEINSSKTVQNSDEEVARLLQEQFKKELEIEKPTNSLVYDDKKKKTNLNSSKSLVDPSWEVIDPTPNIHTLFMAFNDRFFWNKLLAVCVSWSKRMTTCAGICSYQGRGGMCKITLSEPLLKLRPRKDLVETLLHEMIHAFLFVTHNNKDRDGHGPEFHKHMYRINNEAGTNITVYHDFHDEVRLYKTHWWKCDGPCQHRKPFYGMVKRASNRAPGPNDRWWEQHVANCGGNFIKIKEPEKPVKQSKSKENKENIKKSTSDIRNFMPPVTNKSPNTNSNTKALPSSSKKSNIHTISNNTDNNAQVSAVIPSKVNNIFGFTNLNGNSSSRPKSSTGSNDSKVKGFGGGLKGAVRNTSSTVVINKNPSTKTKDSNNSPKTEKSNNSFTPISQPLGGNSQISVSNSDYSVVRNHWLNKFANNSSSSKIETKSNKRPLSNEAETEVSPKVPKLNDECKSETSISQNSDSTNKCAACPVCNKQIPIDELNNHLDTCLNNAQNTNENECIICGKKIASSEYERHVIKCSEENFDDNDDVFIVQSSDTPKKDSEQNCNDDSVVLMDEPSNHVKKDRFNSTEIDDNDVLDLTLQSENEDDTKQCPECKKMLTADEYDVHVEKCLLKFYEELEKKYGINTDNKVDCLACGKKVLKTELNGHLEECMNDVFDEKFVDEGGTSTDQNKDKQTLNGDKSDIASVPKYSCPFCMTLVSEADMNSHIDTCLNVQDEKEESNLNKSNVLDSFSCDDF